MCHHNNDQSGRKREEKTHQKKRRRPLPRQDNSEVLQASVLPHFYDSTNNDAYSCPVSPYSLDQYTSFAKEPWGFDRPENRKEHSLLSRATFAEWPNTTCDFSIERGLAPPGKLSVSTARVVDRSGSATVSMHRNSSDR